MPQPEKCLLKKSQMCPISLKHNNNSIGRFTSTDPFPGYRGIPSTIHPYNYCGNNPVNFVDPLGLGWVEIWDPETDQWIVIWEIETLIIIGEPEYDYEDYGYFDSYDAWKQGPPQYGNEAQNQGVTNVNNSSFPYLDFPDPHQKDRAFAEFMKKFYKSYEMIGGKVRESNWQPYANTAAVHGFCILDVVLGLPILSSEYGENLGDYPILAATGGNMAYGIGFLCVAAGAKDCPVGGVIVGGFFIGIGGFATYETWKYYEANRGKGVFK